MKFLIFLLGIVYFFIFFLFSQNASIEGYFFKNLFFEANFYVGLSVVFLFFLFSRRMHLNAIDIKKEQTPRSLQSFSYKEIISFLKLFFEKYIYYIAITSAYISVYLLFHAIFGEIRIPNIFLICNTVIIALYFIEEKFKVFQDFLRVNIVIISLYYIIFHLWYLIGNTIVFQMLDVINIFLLAVSFTLFLKSKRAKKYKKTIQSYILSFIFLEYCVITKIFFGEFIIYALWGSYMLSIIFLSFTQIISQRLHVSLIFLRTWGVLYAYIFLILASTFIFQENTTSLFIAIGSISMLYILYQFHIYFENYLSLLFSLLAFFISTLFFYNIFISDTNEKEFLYVYFFSVSFIVLFFDGVRKQARKFDTYIYHITSLIVNIFGIISFFFFQDISILVIAYIFAGESFYFFVSYYTFRKKARLGYIID